MPSSTTARLIDGLPTPSPRPKEMQVLALGMSRTGTYSMFTALGILGYKPYHMAELKDTAPGTHALWVEALKAKYHDQTHGPATNNPLHKPYARAEFDKLLGGYSAVTDIPCIMFAADLIAAYPDAKILITTRAEDTWVKSVSTLFNTLLRWHWSPLSRYDPVFPYDAPFHVQGYLDILHIVWNLWTGGDWRDEDALRRTFRKHYALVRELVPPERLLEFDPREGWSPLCKHLGKQVPRDVPYPNLNDLPFTIWFHEQLWWATARKAAVSVAMTWGLPVAGAFAALGWYWYSKRGPI
ncbi:MAG: hypothetical protein LQ341_005566 [Variospora aurantia]|nr:MAG: hypothetical protein LQ341_005566 [Variospora aurantia]